MFMRKYMWEVLRPFSTSGSVRFSVFQIVSPRICTKWHFLFYCILTLGLKLYEIFIQLPLSAIFQIIQFIKIQNNNFSLFINITCRCERYRNFRRLFLLIKKTLKHQADSVHLSIIFIFKHQPW